MLLETRQMNHITRQIPFKVTTLPPEEQRRDSWLGELLLNSYSQESELKLQTYKGQKEQDILQHGESPHLGEEVTCDDMINYS